MFILAWRLADESSCCGLWTLDFWRRNGRTPTPSDTDQSFLLSLPTARRIIKGPQLVVENHGHLPRAPTRRHVAQAGHRGLHADQPTSCAPVPLDALAPAAVRREMDAVWCADRRTNLPGVTVALAPASSKRCGHDEAARQIRGPGRAGAVAVARSSPRRSWTILAGLGTDGWMDGWMDDRILDVFADKARRDSPCNFRHGMADDADRHAVTTSSGSRH